MNHIAVIGEIVADAFVSPDPIPGTLDLHVRPGGGPANTAAALADSAYRVTTRVRPMTPVDTIGAGDVFRSRRIGSACSSHLAPCFAGMPIR